MLFNSLDFAIFLPLFFALYWAIPKNKLHLRHLLIFVSSYIFYAWWDWRFVSLILISTVTDYIVSIKLSETSSIKTRKLLLSLSLLVNIGFLVYFKYANFFIDSFIGAFAFLGQDIQIRGLDIILPVGISFYTFQTLSYTIDVYRKNIEAERNFVLFSAYVAYFPQLVAGPIERASNLIPEFKQPKVFDYK